MTRNSCILHLCSGKSGKTELFTFQKVFLLEAHFWTRVSLFMFWAASFRNPWTEPESIFFLKISQQKPKSYSPAHNSADKSGLNSSKEKVPKSFGVATDGAPYWMRFEQAIREYFIHLFPRVICHFRASSLSINFLPLNRTAPSRSKGQETARTGRGSLR